MLKSGTHNNKKNVICLRLEIWIRLNSNVMTKYLGTWPTISSSSCVSGIWPQLCAPVTGITGVVILWVVFSLAQRFHSSSMESESPSFWRLNNIPLHIHSICSWTVLVKNQRVSKQNKKSRVKERDLYRRGGRIRGDEGDKRGWRGWSD